MKILSRTALAALAMGLLRALFCQKSHAQAPIVGNITFAGTVSLDAASVNDATMVTAWDRLGAGGLPQVQSHDGSFNGFVTDGDGTTFHAPWSFNIPPAGQISSFWSVDGFTFDLLTSHIFQQGGGSLTVQGTGNVSHSGFTTTPGTFSFTTQDPSASSRFSFSAATAVPESSATVLFAIGGLCVAGGKLLRRKK